MYLLFDTETTGIPSDWKAPVTDLNNWPRLVQLAYILYDTKGNKLKEADYIIKPNGYLIPNNASSVHGITTEKALKEGKPLSEVLGQFDLLARQAKYLIAHNMSFDEKIVGAEFLRLGMKNTLSSKKKICTMESSTDFCAIDSPLGYKWPKLSELYFKLFNTSFEEAHNANIDIKATSKCFWELVNRNVIVLQDNSDDTNEILALSFDYDTIVRLANEALSNGHFYEAIEYFNKCLNTCSNLKIFNLCVLYNGLGQAYFGLEKYDEAESLFNKSIEIFPSLSSPYENLAAVYFKMEKYDEFFETCDLIRSNFPISAKVWYYLGHAHENRGRYDTARVAYQNAIIEGMHECVADLNNLFKKMNNDDRM